LSDLAAIPDTSSLDNNDSDYTSFLNQIYWSLSRFTLKEEADQSIHYDHCVH
jgi:hypothetical protein